MNLVTKGVEFAYKIYFPESSGTPPAYTIKTPVGLSFLTGTGEALYEDDWYVCEITIPPTAPSSTADQGWSITWSDGTNTKQVYFDVQDPEIPEDDIYLRELTKFVIEGSDYVFKIVVAESPEECYCNFYRGSTLIASEIEADIEDHRLGKQITWTIEASYFSAGEHVIIYTTDIQQYHQRVLVAPIGYLPELAKLRFLVDRILKSIDQPQTYLESDLVTAIFGGIDIINIYSPLTEWDIFSLPSAIKPLLQFAAGIYLLNSQYMLESDLAFAYSGNTVSLDYDRTGAIESEIGRLQEMLQENLPKAKKNVLRDSPGVVGVTTSPVGPQGLVISKHHRLIKHM